MISVVLLMAGKGQRMNSNINKVLLPINGKKIYEYSLELFLSFGFEVICVISEEDKNIKLPVNVKYTIGGKTRSESVLNGLRECSGDYVLIHDSARPFIAKEVIDEILKIRDNNKAILTYFDVVDTIKLIEDNKIKTLPRSNLIAAGTPQCASLEVFLKVYNKALEDNYLGTDDISLIEKYLPEIKIDLVKCNDEAFKITTKKDYILAKSILGNEND